MEFVKTIKSSQEQAVASWINYLNQVRLDRLMEALSKQDLNLTEAMETIETAFNTVKEDIIIRNRGGSKGMHGFIAEIAECGIGNARQQIIGKAPIYVWINDNGPDDLIRGAEAIQQKFVQAGGHLSLRAVAEHLKHYPHYLNEGHKYQIPKDHYQKIISYLSISKEEAYKLPTTTGEFSLRQWEEVHTFFESNNFDVSKLEPSILEYREVQQATIADTFENEKHHLLKLDREKRNTAYHESKPSLNEGIKATIVGAAVEGATTFTISVVNKCRSGKRIKDFNQDDWLEVVGDTGKGTVKGSVRGASIYALTNYTATPAAVASALTTASFGIAEQAHMLRAGRINQEEFIENSELLCLDATVSALSSYIGQVVIPVPVLGAIIGNAIGTMTYQIAKDSLSRHENEIIQRHLHELSSLDESLARNYEAFINQSNNCLKAYMELLNTAFDPNIEIAFAGSIELAKSVGVPISEILDGYDSIYTYFME